MTYNPNGNTKKETSMSGIVILMMAIIRNNSKETMWKDHLLTISKTCKNDSLKSYAHHDTK